MKIRKILANVVFLVVFLFSSWSFALAETILLKDGRKVEGVLWERTDKYVKLFISGVLTTFFNDEIDPSYFTSQSFTGAGNQTITKASNQTTLQTTPSSKIIPKAAPDIKPSAAAATGSRVDEQMAPGKKSMLLCKQGAELASEGKFKEATEVFKQSSALAKIAPQGFDSFALGGLRTCQDVTSGVISDEAGRSIAQSAILVTQKKTDQSFKLLEKVAAQYPNYAPIWHDLGMNYMSLGLMAKAVDAFEKSLALEPDNPDSYYGLAAAKIALGQFAEGKNFLDKTRELYVKQGRKSNVRYVDAWLKKLAEKML